MSWASITVGTRELDADCTFIVLIHYLVFYYLRLLVLQAERLECCEHARGIEGNDSNSYVTRVNCQTAIFY